MSIIQKIKNIFKLMEAKDFYQKYTYNFNGENKTQHLLDLLQSGIDICNDVLRVDRENVKALLLKTQLLIEKENFSEARDSIDKILIKKPKHTEALLHLASIHSGNENLEQAVEVLEKILSIDPSEYLAVDFLIRIYLYRKEKEKALHYIEMILSGPARNTANKTLIDMVKLQKEELLEEK